MCFSEEHKDNRPVRLLLVSPRFPESFWSFRWAIAKIFPEKSSVNPPLGLATLAALCPPDWQIEIVDENVETLPVDPEADIVGVCGMGVQFHRQQELLRYYRSRGHYVVAGGSYASLCPERYSDFSDTVIAGEAEYIWPRFCRDYMEGQAAAFYQETGEVRLQDSPAPRYDLLKLDRYTTVSMQFSRGCPYRCDFCDIIVMFGRKPRTKSLEQIGVELDLLRSLGIQNLFFVDDNLIGNKKLAKQLLRFLSDYQKKHNYRFVFGTEVSLNLAEDEDMLRLFRAANFGWVFIGIESPDEDILRGIGKTQNVRRNMLSSIRTIYRHGIDVLAGFIVGFDNDNLDTFERQYRFITLSGIQVAMVGLLTALPRTPLYYRLEKEGRLIPEAQHGDNTKLGTNFIPKRMDYQEMVSNYQSLFQRLFSDHSIAARIRYKFRYLSAPVVQGQYSFNEALKIIGRFFRYGLLPGGPLRMLRFLKTLTVSKFRAWPMVITDWISGISMRDYVRRHFAVDSARGERLVLKTAVRLKKRFQRAVQRGFLEITTDLKNGGINLELVLRGHVAKIYSARTARRLKRLLRRSAATLTLHIEELRIEQKNQLEQLLKQLAPYGQRISIWTSQQTRRLLAIDSSVFHVILVKPETVAR